MAVSAKYNLGLTVENTVTLGPVAGDVTFTTTNAHSGKIDASTTTVPATKTFVDTFPTIVGTVTLDMQALAYTTGELDDVDMTGLKLQLVKFSAPTTNTAFVEIRPNVANGYNPFGEDNAALDRIQLEPGDVHLAYHPDTLAEVGAAEKDMDFESTAIGEITVEFVAG